MTKKIKTTLAILLSLLMLLSFAGCAGDGQSEVPADTSATAASATEALSETDLLWQAAEYTEDTTLGEGKTTFELEVVVGENSVTFTVNTDKESLGDALLENKLVAGEDSEYGLYVKVVNGITADYDVNQYYWSFTKNGEMMMTGVDGEKAEAGAHYELTCTK